MQIIREGGTAYYSNVVTHGSTIYLAGQIPDDYGKDIAGQTTEVLAKIDRLLGGAGSDKSRLLALTVYLRDFADYGAFNATFGAWLDSGNKPARATVRADMLDPGIRIEISAIAASLEATPQRSLRKQHHERRSAPS